MPLRELLAPPVEVTGTTAGGTVLVIRDHMGVWVCASRPMSFTDQKPFVVSKETRAAFIRHKRRFNCVLCGRDFAVGDTARWVFAANNKTYNFFTCPACDGPDVLDRAAKLFAEAVKLAKQWNIYGPEWQ